MGGREAGRKEEREKPILWFTFQMQGPALGPAMNSTQASHRTGRHPSSWGTFHCSPSSSKLGWNPNSQDLSQCSYGILVLYLGLGSVLSFFFFFLHDERQGSSLILPHAGTQLPSAKHRRPCAVPDALGYGYADLVPGS